VKQVIHLFLAAFIFLGNIGIPVYTHACEEDGVFTSFFINQQNHCQEKHVDVPPCCQKEKKKNCCHDEKTVVQLDEKFVLTNAFSLPIITFHFASNAIEFSPLIFQSASKTLIKNWVDPPPIRRFGKELLIFHSVFRI
jgi:hypothetical protein